MPHEIAGIAECLICHRKFSGPMGLEIQAAGARAHQIAGYMLKLAQHLVEDHPQESSAIDTNALAYQGMLRLSNFRTTDPALQEQRDRFRWEVHQRTMATRVSDETISTKTGEVTRLIFDKLIELGYAAPGLPGSDHDAEDMREVTTLLIPLFTFLRDELEEKGRYKNQAAQIVQGVTH